jgi:hypothetical protein
LAASSLFVSPCGFSTLHAHTVFGN